MAYETQAVLEFSVLSQPLQCWDCRPGPLYLAVPYTLSSVLRDKPNPCKDWTFSSEEQEPLSCLERFAFLTLRVGLAPLGSPGDAEALDIPDGFR